MPCVRKAGPCESAATKAEEWRIRQSMACIGRGGVGVQWQGVDKLELMVSPSRCPLQFHREFQYGDAHGAWDVGEAVKVTLPASRSTSSNLYSKSSEIYRYSSLLPCSCPLVTYVGYRATSGTACCPQARQLPVNTAKEVSDILALAGAVRGRNPQPSQPPIPSKE